MLHETRLAVMTPSIVEAVTAVLIGLIVWLVAQWGNADAQRA